MEENKPIHNEEEIKPPNNELPLNPPTADKSLLPAAVSNTEAGKKDIEFEYF